MIVHEINNFLTPDIVSIRSMSAQWMESERDFPNELINVFI